jgi:multiple sugar transport system ATP-binding protein
MVFQGYALYPHLSVYDNMAFSLKYRRAVPKAEVKKRVSDAARILELEPFLDRKPRQLSGGQRQRVAMGRAIVRQPRAFLMDEPLSNLDAKLRVQMRAEIAQLQRSLGTTTIYVTHDQTEAMTLGSRVAVLNQGVLQQIASPQEMYRNPANLFVAGFIGSPPMNLIDAKLERGSAGSAGPDSSAGSASPAGPQVVFGSHRLGIPAQVMADRAGLERYLGRDIVLGVRPEHLSDAALMRDADGESVIELPVRLREELGSDVQIHCGIGAVAHQEGAAADDVSSLATLVARMDPQTALAEGQNARVHVETTKLHFFDPETGAAIRD